MVLVIVGGILAALGLLAGGLLVAAPLGWVAASPGPLLWVLFPLFTLVGYALLAVGSRDPAVKAPTQLLAIPLLLVAVVAAVALVADGAGLLTATGGTAALWFVMLFGGVLGTVGAAVSAPSRSG
ncbi:MAG TPA: hypothetical protein VJM48_09290 [Methylibium sp.]|nr:hypothetical protein [Methylibium sp.]